MLDDLRIAVKEASDPEKAAFFPRFFKTGKGEYGEGDVFCGLTVPHARKIAVKFQNLPMADVKQLLKSRIHEERLVALLILAAKFKKSDKKVRAKIVHFYLEHTKYINNWDLVDLSSDIIIGEYVWNNKTEVLVRLANAQSLWEKRIAIVSSFAFIKHGEAETTYMIADILLHDSHDLIQKAVGWMLRETGKRVSEEKLETYLKPRYQTMPRTMLRYAIERFSEEKRKRYLRGDI